MIRTRWVLPIAFATSVLLCVSCKRCGEGVTHAAPVHTLTDIGLTVPQLPGWKRDETGPFDSASGGTALRLVRENAPPGSPRIQVEVTAPSHRVLELDTYLQESLRDLAKLEAAGTLRITLVEQHPGRVGPRKAYRLRHEYTLGAGEVPMAVTQITTLLILDGRGVSITAVGRSELFHPLAAAVDDVFAGLSTTAGAPQSTPVQTIKPVPLNGAPRSDDNGSQPIDLGELGGR